jgi:hypothetical protein
VCAYFALNLGKNGVETYAILKDALFDEYWSHACTFKWFKRFKEG